jgi:hypothetical protein
LVSSFGVVLTQTLQNFFNQNGLNSTVCSLNTVISSWYVDIRQNGVQLQQYGFFNGIGPSQFPTDSQWVTALGNALDNLLTSGYSYNIDVDNENVGVFNNNCVPNFDDFQINVGIEFEIFCNQ